MAALHFGSDALGERAQLGDIKRHEDQVMALLGKPVGIDIAPMRRWRRPSPAASGLEVVNVGFSGGPFESGGLIGSRR